ncbi:ATP-binding cassette family protein [Streptomyces sp. CB01201]|uniref:AAA family ATPase n=1 Tax=Streptomyces sp. CB01201 TaxID=2020324 RepID=UPI000C27C1BD|nr:SMC family ATPase [Streptomyces sp. CB01201]PJN04419.1 ATP-binding cassette family protein [Streptomyces sp. CB01201]
MRLHRMRVTAFGPFAGSQEVDFDALSTAGLFLLHGPTGAGKTSVLDAVCFALYGAVPGARQSPGTPLRSDHAAPDVFTEVLLELTVAGRRLEVTRRPQQDRPKKRGSGVTTEKAQTWLREYDPSQGAWQALSRSHQEIGEELGQLLGMSREQFCQVVLLPQGEFAKFLRSDAEARGKLLGRLFDTRRFAAVEDRLAELRRTAERQVKEGDERLLALAQRMAQAAGDGYQARAWPLPDARPGDPGLASAVLQWAAVARSAATERLDIASAALAAAERRQDRARRLAEEAGQLAALQARYAEARAEADELAARGPEQEELRARLETARKAERVAPALEWREQAQRDHRTATAERDRSRERLHPDLAEAGADQLAALERRMRQDLGALESARRAERRSIEIDEERSRLDQRSRADEGVLTDTADWLGRWEHTRLDHQTRIEAAHEAATRAEHLAGQLEPARRRLAAARERDALQDRLGEAERRHESAREAANAAHERWLTLREERLRGIAAELAARLQEGEPCTVCGSAEHPAPARPGTGQVDRATEDAAQQAHRDAERRRAEAEAALSSVREEIAGARAEAGAASVAELADAARELEREHRVARDAAGGLHEARLALAAAEREYEQRLAAQRTAQQNIAARTASREALDREQAALESELSQVRAGAASVAEQAGLLEHRAAILAEAAEAVRAVEDSAARLKEADGRLSEAAFRAGFDTPAAASAALVDERGQRDIQHRLDAWQQRKATVGARLAEPETAAAGRAAPARTEEAAAEAAVADRALRDAASALAAARARCAELRSLSARSVEETRRIGPLREEYERVASLAGLTAGTSADNERKMRLESYVLAARLEQVAAAATARLQRMSGGRYTLVHSDARGGRGRSGLGLHVVDAWTGRERDTATLSGGETFFASLALALGLADVVTDEAGGARLDTLFIDEGFGSLDDQTLDEVLDVLDSLRERDRSVGIVSHVGDLRRRIPAQLEVVKDRTGSAVRLRGIVRSGSVADRAPGQRG